MLVQTYSRSNVDGNKISHMLSVSIRPGSDKEDLLVPWEIVKRLGKYPSQPDLLHGQAGEVNLAATIPDCQFNSAR